jgi:GAF domain
MSSSSNLDRGPFEEIPDSASNPRQSFMRAHSFPAAANQLSLGNAGPKLERALHAIASDARQVANADGVAIAVAKGDELVYSAGSGTAASFVGRRVMATFIVSSRGDLNREILRVENAETDHRIEGAICRQLGFKSLLILPIPKSAGLAGVIEISFNEPHSFRDDELAAYQTVAGLAGEAINQDAQAELRKAPHAQGAPLCPSCGAVLKEGGTQSPSTLRIPPSVTIATHSRKHNPLHIRLWKVADAVAVAIVLVISSWIAYTYISPSGPSAQKNLNATVETRPVNTSVSLLDLDDASTVPNRTQPEPRAQTAWRRVRVGDDEVDYVSDDVTIRHFIPRRSKQERAGRYRVDYVSEDVTVRHFTPSPSQSNR